MDTDLEKEEMLRTAGFKYDFRRMAYVHRQARKIVSVEAVEDRPQEWLGEMIAEVNDSGEWRFYFEQPPSSNVRQAILADLG